MAKALSEEQIEDLIEFKGTPGYKALFALIEAIVQNEERRVLSYNLETGDKEQLAILKSLAEGGRKVLTNLRKELTRLVP